MIVPVPNTTETPAPVTRNATVAEAAQLMLSEDADELPVVDGDEIVGVVTDRDLVAKVMARKLDPARTRVADVCSARGA